MSVSLAKGQGISLAKPDGSSFSNVKMGLGWDAVAAKGFLGKLKGSSIDLDASCMLFDAHRQLVDQVWFQQLQSKDGAIRHTGDNVTGKGEGDDESLIVDLNRVASNVTTLVFVVNSFTGQSFDRVKNAFCRLVDNTSDQEVARYDLSSSGSHTAQVMVKLSRTASGWTMQAIGENATGRTFHDLLPVVVPHL